jgi:hypothetical protein
MHGVLKLREQIIHGPDEGWRERYHAVGTEELVALNTGQSPTDA